jgi:cell division septation protein DedD
MSNVKVVCWGLLAVLGVAALETSIVGASAGRVNEDTSKVLKIDQADCLVRLNRACLTSQRLLSTEDLARNKEKQVETKGQLISQAPVTPKPTPSPSATVKPTPTPVATPRVIPADLELFGSQNIPTTVRLRDLNSSWRAMGTNGPLELGNFQMIVNSSAGGSFAATYYTKGETVTIGSETYIVAYSLFTLVDKVTPDLPLSLSLLNVKTIGSLSNIRPFDSFKETKVLEKQLAMIKLSNVWDPTKAAEPEPSYSSSPVPVPAETVTPRPTKKPTKKPRTRTRRNR